MSKNKIVLSDSIIYRQTNETKGLIPYPTLLFGDSIEYFNTSSTCFSLFG